MMISLALLLSSGIVSVAAQAACPALPSPLPSFDQLPEIQSLPNPFVFYNGTPLSSPSDWACRREEIKTLVQEYHYGYYPDPSQETVTAQRSGNRITISISAEGRTGSFATTITLPSGASEGNPAPVLIHTGGVDTGVFLNAGVALAEFSPNDVAADSNSKTGAFWSIYNGRDVGVLLAWGWGFHRIIDALESAAPEIDTSRVAVNGCSRYGKAALAAGIFDERVTLTLPFSSGLEGVAPWRFFYEGSGENEKINNIVGAYPYWTNQKLATFVPNVRKLPIDANFKASLVAPRAIVWDTGVTDYWTNPEGAAAVTFPATHVVFEWLGVGDQAGVAIRNGWHCETPGYANIRDFMMRVFFNQTITRDYTDTSPYTPHAEAFPWIASIPAA